ncbi:MAG TPA: DUF2231 domain-containing protein [Sphingobacteriaceae bacterium]
MHLLITHLPIFGSVLGALVLIIGIATGSRSTLNAAYVVLLISAIGGMIAYSTGESAEETVEHLPGVSRGIIEAHEEVAKITVVTTILMGVFSALALLTRNSNKNFIAKTLSRLVLVIALLSFGMAAYTGYLGGQIRHTEIKNNVNQTPETNNPKDGNRSID